MKRKRLVTPRRVSSNVRGPALAQASVRAPLETVAGSSRPVACLGRVTPEVYLITCFASQWQIIAINPDLITWIDVTPDTTVSLLGGDKIIVRESLDEVIDRWLLSAAVADRALDSGSVAQRARPIIASAPRADRVALLPCSLRQRSTPPPLEAFLRSKK